MLLLAAALSLMVQDPPPGEVVSTAPPPPSAAAMADPFAAPPPPERPRSTLDLSAFAADVEAQGAAAAAAAGAPSPPHYGRLGARPLPAAAYEDPIRYAADACRTGTRPEGEDMGACYARIEATVAAAAPPQTPRRPRVEVPAPRVRCENSQSRDDDGRTSSTSGRCSWGTGDPAVIDDLLDRW